LGGVGVGVTDSLKIVKGGGGGCHQKRYLGNMLGVEKWALVTRRG